MSYRRKSEEEIKDDFISEYLELFEANPHHALRMLSAEPKQNIKLFLSSFQLDMIDVFEVLEYLYPRIGVFGIPNRSNYETLVGPRSRLFPRVKSEIATYMDCNYPILGKVRDTSNATQKEIEAVDQFHARHPEVIASTAAGAGHTQIVFRHRHWNDRAEIRGQAQKHPSLEKAALRAKPADVDHELLISAGSDATFKLFTAEDLKK